MRRRACSPVLILVSVLSVWPGPARAQPSIAPGVAGEFSLSEIGDGFRASMSQMCFGPDGRLYIASFQDGVLRFDYDPQTDLPAPVQVSSVRSLGVAFHASGVHGICMYLTPYGGGEDPASILRLTDDDGDGHWGEAGETNALIVDNIPIGLHRVNQLQIHGNALHVGIGTRTDAGNNESSYNGTICWIQDLDLVPSVPNAAGFAGLDFFSDAAPYTSTSLDKLIVHSSATRNPFGLAFDGDGQLWMTNNQNDVAPITQDQIFLATPGADFGYPCGNPSVDWRSSPATLGAGFFDPLRLVSSLTIDLPNPAFDPDDPTPASPPGGLGPNSSADGFAFYDANAFPLRFHQDAFVARASSSSPAFTGLPETYEDLVAVDRNTGEVVQIADDFNRPLDVLIDPAGKLLFVEFHRFGNGNGQMYRIEATNPVQLPHAFAWGVDGDGEWFDRLAWNTGFPAKDRLAPNEWGSARYAVSIDREGSNPLVDLAANARVEHLFLGDRLRLQPDARLSVDDEFVLSGSGELRIVLDGNGGAIAHPSIEAGGRIQLAGRLVVEYAPGTPPAPGSAVLLMSAAEISGGFASVSGPDAYALDWNPGALELTIGGASAGDAAHPRARSRIDAIQPNPFNPGTSIHFALDANGPAWLAVHDLAGRRVRTLVNEVRTAGEHVAFWNGRDTNGRPIASGVYFARLIALGEDSVQRMTLLK